MNRPALLLSLLLAVPAFAQKPAAPQGKTEITWYGHAAFLIKTPSGKVLAIDPWITNPADKDGQAALQKIDKVDYILLTHGHFDHVGDTIALQKKTGAKIVAAFELGADLVRAGVPKDAAGMDTLGSVGGTLHLGDDLDVTFVQAVHGSGFQAGNDGAIEYGGPAVGYVIHVKGGPTIYHSGDTAYFGEMRHIGQTLHPDVALVCIGDHFTMGPADAARAVRDLGAKVAVPMHFGTFPVLTGTPAEFAKALRTEHAKAKMVTLQIGQPHAF